MYVRFFRREVKLKILQCVLCKLLERYDTEINPFRFDIKVLLVLHCIKIHLAQKSVLILSIWLYDNVKSFQLQVWSGENLDIKWPHSKNLCFSEIEICHNCFLNDISVFIAVKTCCFILRYTSNCCFSVFASKVFRFTDLLNLHYKFKEEKKRKKKESNGIHIT